MSRMVQAIANDINACILNTPGQLVNTANSGVITPFTTGKTEFRFALVLGCKSKDGTVNATAVKIGPSASASEQPITINPGDTYVLQPCVGAKWNFADWNFVPSTTGDGIVVIYS